MASWLRRMFARPDAKRDSRADEIAAQAARYTRALAKLVKVHPADTALNDEYRRSERQLEGRDR